MERSTTIVTRFADIARRFPDRPALLTDPTPVTYAALADAVGGCAEALRRAGVQPGQRVGVLAGHGVPAVTGILGALGAGCAYVPLDPGFPVERLAHMRDAADVSIVLTTREFRDLADRLGGVAPRRTVLLDDLPAAPLRPTPVDPDDTAYVLFTSGSTGRPKAVAQTHRNLAHVVDNQIGALGITDGDRLSLLASFSFDAAIPDLYPALLTGAAVVPVDVRRHGVPYAAELLARHRVTVYHSTPTVYRYLLDALGARRLDSVRVVLLGGEQATYADALRGRDRFAADCVLVNGYGATEVTFAAQYRLPVASVDPAASGPLPIGDALPGYQLLLRAGTDEIVVRSHHLAPGYLDQDSDRFGTDPDGTPCYRTGDLGRVLPDGRLVCLGRLDRQVKIRGFRVEPAEVESVLRTLPGVDEARVIARDGELLGYARCGGSAPTPAELRAGLARVLPDYAVPRAVVVLDRFPLTVTGKIDERALPDPAPVTAPTA
ncbi:MAG TPA: amino acid adenylation domain-containing protein, partial [Micromonospora sp.]